MGTADELLGAALEYAAKGWPVLPLHSLVDGGACTCGALCTCGVGQEFGVEHAKDCERCGSPGKHPRNRRGLTDATTLESIIRSWWKRWPEANIGLRTGVAFDVVDCDGTEGMNAWYEFCDRHGYEHRGPSALTGGGGLHVLVAPTGQGNRAKFIPGCDYRGDGGYIVAAPSTHASGRQYTWL